MTPKRNSTDMAPEYKAALEEIEKLDTLNDEALAALWKIADHIPELWGDECKDGYVRLNISADAIEAVQAAICQKVSDIELKPSDADLLEALQGFMSCRTAQGAKCVPNDSDFEKGAEAIRKAEEK